MHFVLVPPYYCPAYGGIMETQMLSNLLRGGYQPSAGFFVSLNLSQLLKKQGETPI